MENFTRKEKPVSLIGILPKRETTKIEEVLVRIMFLIQEGKIKKDPKAHERLLNLGKTIAEQDSWSSVRGKEVEEFLSFRKG
jgi:hypothetical protein